MRTTISRNLHRRRMHIKHRQATITVLTYAVLSLAGVVTFRLPETLSAEPVTIHPTFQPVATLPPATAAIRDDDAAGAKPRPEPDEAPRSTTGDDS